MADLYDKLGTEEGSGPDLYDQLGAGEPPTQAAPQEPDLYDQLGADSPGLVAGDQVAPGETVRRQAFDKPLAESGLPLTGQFLHTLGDPLGFIRSQPEAPGPGQVGFDRWLALQTAGRQGATPLATQVGENRAMEMVTGTAQFGANVLAGGAAVAAGILTWPFMGSVLLGREVGEGAGHWAMRAKFGAGSEATDNDPALRANISEEDWDPAKHGYSSKAAIQKSLRKGAHSRDAWMQRINERTVAAGRAMVYGLSPAIASAAMAEKGDKWDAFANAFYQFPVESLLGPAMLLKPTMRIGGKKLPVKVRAGDDFVQVESVAGEPLHYKKHARKAFYGLVNIPERDVKLNPWLHKSFHHTPDWAKPVLWDLPDAVTEMRHSFRDSFARHPDGDAIRTLADEYASPEVIDGFRQKVDELTEQNEVPLTDPQKEAILFGMLEKNLHRNKKGEIVVPGDDSVQLKKEYDSVVGDPGAGSRPSDMVARQRLGESMKKAGLSDEDIALNLAYIQRIVPDAVENLLPEQAQEYLQVIRSLPAIKEIVDGPATGRSLAPSPEVLRKQKHEYIRQLRDWQQRKSEQPLSFDEFEAQRPEVEGYNYHGSPDGDLDFIDPYAHTREWKKGTGFYSTESRKVVEGYAAGRTRKGKPGEGRVNYVELNPDAKILDMELPPDMEMWNQIAKNMDVEPVRGVDGPIKTNFDAYKELVAGIRERFPEGGAPSAAVEALVDYGYHATSHMEGLKSGNLHRVTIVIDDAGARIVPLKEAHARYVKQHPEVQPLGEPPTPPAERVATPESQKYAVPELANEGAAEVAERFLWAADSRKVDAWIKKNEVVRGPKWAKDIRKKIRKIAMPRSKFRNAADVYNNVNEGITGMMTREEGATLVAGAMKGLAQKMKHDTNWVAYAFSETVTKGKYTHVPMKSVHPITEKLPRILAKMDEANVAAGKRSYELPVSEHGALLYTQPMKLFIKGAKQIENAAGGSEAAVAAQARLLGIIRSHPTVRFISDAKTPALARWVSREMSNPQSDLYRFYEPYRLQQEALVETLGQHPLTILQNYDAYLSRSWSDMTTKWAAIQRDLGAEVFGIPMKQTSSRHKRQRTDAEAAGALLEKVEAAENLRQKRTREAKELTGDEQSAFIAQHAADLSGFTTHQTVKWTLDNSQWLLENMNYFKQLESYLDSSGMISLEPKTGWVRFLTTKDVTPQAAAANVDPYNFMFGPMAGKYVPPSIAKAFRGLREQYKSVGPLLGMWKLLHTGFNLPGYHVRNELGDLLNLASRSGYTPTHKAWRTARTRSNSLVDRLHDHGKIDGTTAKLISDGLLQQPGVDATPMVTGDAMTHAGALGSHVLDQTLRGVSQDATGAMKTTTMLQRFYDLGTVGKGAWEKWGVPVRLRGNKKGIKLGKAYREAVDAAKAEWYAREGYPVAMSGSAGIREFTRQLADTAVIRWTVKRENQRRAQAYFIAKDGLGLKHSEAVQWALDTLHDYGDKPAAMTRLQTNALSKFIVPPFLTYGYKQANFTMRMMLHRPEHYMMKLMVDGMNAYDVTRTAQEDGGDKHFLAGHQFAALTTFGSNRLLMGSGRDIAQMFHAAGGGGKWLRAFKGYDKHGNMHELTMTLPLRDIANLNTVLHDIQPDDDVLRRVARMNPFTDAFFVFMNPSSLYSPAQGSGVAPSNPSTSVRAYRALGYLAKMFVPVDSWQRSGPLTALPGGAAYEAARGLSQGAIQTRGKRNLPVHPVEAFTRILTPGMGISAVDQANMWYRTVQSINAKKRRMAMESRRQLNKLNPLEEDQALELRQGEINLRYAMHMKALEMNLALTGDRKMHKHMRALKKDWLRASSEVKKRGFISPLEVGTPESKSILKSMIDTAYNVFTNTPEGNE